MLKIVSFFLLLLLISTQKSTYSIDGHFYEHSQLSMALIKRQKFIDETYNEFMDSYVPAIVYFTSTVENKQSRTADILNIQLIQSGIFSKIQLQLFLFGLNQSSHKWQGRGQIQIKRVSNLLMSNITTMPVYFIVNQSTIDFNLDARYRMWIHFNYASDVSHYSMIKLVLLILTGIIVILTVRTFDNIHMISQQCHVLTLILLLSRYLTDSIIITIDNFAFSKHTATQYADALLMLLSFILLIFISMVLFPRIHRRSWKKIIALLVVSAIELVLVSYAFWNILMSLILVPQLFRKGFTQGDTLVITLFLYFQLSNLVMHLFYDNYLYYKSQKWMLILIVVLTVLQCIGLILKKRQRTSEFPLEMSSGIQLESSVLCPICRQAIKDPQTEVTLACGHILHQSCLRQHLKESEVCPIDKVLIEKSQLSLVES